MGRKRRWQYSRTLARALTAMSDVAAVAGIVSQKRQLLPVEPNKPGSEQLHPRAPFIRNDKIRP